MIKVRVAKITDMNAIGEILCAAWQAAYRGIIPNQVLSLVTPKHFATKAKESLLRPRNECSATLLSENAGKVVGVLTLGDSRDGDLISNLVAEIEGIHIAPNAWRQGHGTALLRAALDGMKTQGFEEVCVWAATHNKAALAFYANHRFIKDGASRDVSAGGQEIPNLRLRRVL